MKRLKFVLASIVLAILSRGAFAADIGTAADITPHGKCDVLWVFLNQRFDMVAEN